MQAFLPKCWDMHPGKRWKRLKSEEAFKEIDYVYQQSSPERRAELQERYDFLFELCVTYRKPYAQRRRDYQMMNMRHGWEADKRQRRGY